MVDSVAFVSCFKIDGVPILRPLMTDRIRAEMREYRQLAQEIERRRTSATVKPENEVSEEVPVSPVPRPERPDHQPLERSRSFTLPSPSVGLENLPHSSSPVSPAQSRPKLESSPQPEPAHTPTSRIRSNSYTLERPSPLLAEYLSRSMHEPTSLEAVVPMQTSPVESSNDGNLSSEKPKPVQTPVKPARRCKKNLHLDDLPKSTVNCQQRVQLLRLEHDRKMKELLQRQEEEQLQLQESFRKQHEEFLKMIHDGSVADVSRIVSSTPILNNTLDSATDGIAHRSPTFGDLSSSQTLYVSSSSGDGSSSTSPCAEELDATGNWSSDGAFVTCDSNKQSDENGNELHRTAMQSYRNTIARTLHGDDDLRQLCIDDDDPGVLPPSPCTRSREWAATVINSYARGYLVRRLFRTERIQKVVQVIRDTLIFIIDLHHERSGTGSARSPADLQLKRSLLHQLTSSCYTLNALFLATTTREKMEIIRVDREHLKRKLERPSTATSSSTSSGTKGPSSSSSHKASSAGTRHNLQKHSLFAVSINGATDGNGTVTQPPKVVAVRTKGTVSTVGPTYDVSRVRVRLQCGGDSKRTSVPGVHPLTVRSNASSIAEVRTKKVAPSGEKTTARRYLWSKR